MRDEINTLTREKRNIHRSNVKLNHNEGEQI